MGGYVRIPAGAFVMGANPKYPEERNSQRVHVQEFWLQKTEVTNREFAQFVQATGYVTSAEKAQASAVFVSLGQLARPSRRERRWWVLRKGASWRAPEGPGSSWKTSPNHPVVHVSLRDARAFATWSKARLLSEVEWEYAATRGIFDRKRPGSGAIGPSGEPLANIWQGHFPFTDLGKDGFRGRAPVGCFPPNRMGAYDMIGNVWEWTSVPFSRGRYVIKGGSFLCAKSYCHRYRVAARQGFEETFSAGHLGFRLARDHAPKLHKSERKRVAK